MIAAVVTEALAVGNAMHPRRVRPPALTSACVLMQELAAAAKSAPYPLPPLPTSHQVAAPSQISARSFGIFLTGILSCSENGTM